jgi:hypothetical protein
MGHTEKTEGPVESGSSDNGMTKQKSKVDVNNSPDKKSTGDDNNSLDTKKISSSQRLILVQIKLGPAEKSDEKLSGQKLGADDDKLIMVLRRSRQGR